MVALTGNNICCFFSSKDGLVQLCLVFSYLHFGNTFILFQLATLNTVWINYHDWPGIMHIQILTICFSLFVLLENHDSKTSRLLLVLVTDLESSYNLLSCIDFKNLLKFCLKRIKLAVKHWLKIIFSFIYL